MNSALPTPIRFRSWWRIVALALAVVALVGNGIWWHLQLQGQRRARTLKAIDRYEQTLRANDLWGPGSVQELRPDPDDAEGVVLEAGFSWLESSREVQNEAARDMLRLWRKVGGEDLKIVSASGTLLAETSGSGEIRLTPEP